MATSQEHVELAVALAVSELGIVAVRHQLWDQLENKVVFGRERVQEGDIQILAS